MKLEAGGTSHLPLTPTFPFSYFICEKTKGGYNEKYTSLKKEIEKKQ